MTEPAGAVALKQGVYVDQVYTEEWPGNHNNLVGKLALRWKGDDQELNFAVDSTRTRENGPAFVLKGVNFQSGLFNPQNLPLLPPGHRRRRASIRSTRPRTFLRTTSPGAHAVA
jgi:hypothetical protein